MFRLGTLAAASLFAVSLQAAGAVEVTQSVTVAASPSKVWHLIGHFDAISKWLPGAVSSPASKGNKIGSVRVITLKSADGPTVTEKETARKRDSYSYEILKVDPAVLPVSGYTSTITVAKAPGGSVVTWSGSFSPAGGADDAAAGKAVTGLYRSGLDNIKAMIEK